jgi:hypothetical protein
MKKLLVASVVAVAIFAAQVKADTIVFYSFNTNDFSGTMLTPAMTNYVETANIGSGISSFSNFNPAGTPLTILSSVSGSPNNHGFPAGNSVSQNDWTGNSSYFQFTLNATGYQDLVLAWTGNVSSTGPATNGLWYSSDGGATFALFSTFRAPDNNVTVGAVTQDLSSVSALDNNALDVFRIYGTNVVGGAIAAAGTMKIDNFSIDAIAIPEPSTIFLIGCGLVGILPIIRRRRS